MGDEQANRRSAELHQVSGCYSGTTGDPGYGPEASTKAPSYAEIEALLLISQKTVRRALDDCSTMTIWRLRQTDPSFPKAIRLGAGSSGRIYFRLADFRRWIAERERASKAPNGATRTHSSVEKRPLATLKTAIKTFASDVPLARDSVSPPGVGPASRPKRYRNDQPPNKGRARDVS